MASLYEMLQGTGQHLAIGLASINTLRSSASLDKKSSVHLHLVEEMSELTQEIIKIYVRHKDDRSESFHEELADVILLLDQVVRMSDHAMLFEKMEYKINRFKERYQDGRQ